jgi:hypothetical protein
MSPRILIMLLVCVLCPCARSQEASADSWSNVFGNVNTKDLDAAYATRRAASQELAGNAVFDTPNIATALRFSPKWVIAIARISSVQLPKDANGRTAITFHVEQLLRGKSRVTDFDVESRWNPNKVAEPMVFNDPNYSETALDKSEPKAGNRYILGYSLQDYGIYKFLFVPSVVDLQDPGQAELVANVRRFLQLDADAAQYGDETYLTMLDDKLPWVRDIAMYRLSDSGSCYKSPECAARFEAVVRRELQSDVPNERGEAIGWLVWVDSVAREEKKHLLPDSTVSALLDDAAKDRNVILGDEAFQYSEMFKVYRTGSPGDCYEIVPMLRKSVHWNSKHGPVANEHLSYTYGCIPPK